MNQFGIDKFLFKKKDSAVIMECQSSIKIEDEEISAHPMLLLQQHIASVESIGHKRHIASVESIGRKRHIASVESIGRTLHFFLRTSYFSTSTFRK